MLHRKHVNHHPPLMARGVICPCSVCKQNSTLVSACRANFCNACRRRWTHGKERCSDCGYVIGLKDSGKCPRCCPHSPPTPQRKGVAAAPTGASRAHAAAAPTKNTHQVCASCKASCTGAGVHFDKSIGAKVCAPHDGTVLLCMLQVSFMHVSPLR